MLRRPTRLTLLEALLAILPCGACGLSEVGSLGASSQEAGARSDAARDAQDASIGPTDGPQAFDSAQGDAESEAPFDSTLDAGGLEAGAGAGADAQDASCPCGVQSVCVTGSCVSARRVFLSTLQHDGNMGGAVSADSTICGTRAMDANLGGTWAAWISDGTSSVASRFTHSTVGYYLVDGTPIASDWNGLTTGLLLHLIDEDAYGARHTGVTVWTGTNSDGSYVASCNGFTSNSGGVSGAYGDNTHVDAPWSNAGTETCNGSLYVYCFEQ